MLERASLKTFRQHHDSRKADEAHKARAEGDARLEVVIRKDGTEGDSKVLQGLGYGLKASAMDDTAARWRFEPGAKDGLPVDACLNIKVTCRLKN
jgi:TonB family protein